MPPLVRIAVEARREAAVGFGREFEGSGIDPGDQFLRKRLDPGLGQRVAQPVRIERPVCKKLAAVQALYQRRSATQVVSLPGRQAKVGRVAERVGQRHDPGRHAAARAPDGLILSPLLRPVRGDEP